MVGNTDEYLISSTNLIRYNQDLSRFGVQAKGR